MRTQSRPAGKRLAPLSSGPSCSGSRLSGQADDRMSRHSSRCGSTTQSISPPGPTSRSREPENEPARHPDHRLQRLGARRRAIADSCWRSFAGRQSFATPAKSSRPRAWRPESPREAHAASIQNQRIYASRSRDGSSAHPASSPWTAASARYTGLIRRLATNTRSTAVNDAPAETASTVVSRDGRASRAPVSRLAPVAAAKRPTVRTSQ